MLERFQRFSAKKVQNFHRRTRSNICCIMLGLPSVESYVDASKLKFARRLLTLPGYSTSKMIFLHRLFQGRFTQKCSGPSSEIDQLCKKYSLNSLDYFLETGTFPDKLPWKHIIKNVIKSTELHNYTSSIQDDPELQRFALVHPDPSQINVIWRLAKQYPHLLSNCFMAAKFLSNPFPYENPILCEFCGKLTADYQNHYLMECSHTAEERDTFWRHLINNLNVETSAGLYNLSDEEFLPVILGGPHELLHNVDIHKEFMKYAVNFIAKTMYKTNILH